MSGKIRKSKRAKYRSGLERKAAVSLHRKKIPFSYEKEKIVYVVPSVERVYVPDFCIVTTSGKKIYIETKGIWDADDRRKHLLIKRQRPDLDIRFVFSNPNMRLSKKSKTTYADICEGRGRIPYRGVIWKYSAKTIPPDWLNE